MLKASLSNNAFNMNIVEDVEIIVGLCVEIVEIYFGIVESIFIDRKRPFLVKLLYLENFKIVFRIRIPTFGDLYFL